MLEKTMGNFTSNRFVTLDKSQLIINALLAAKDDVKEILMLVVPRVNRRTFARLVGKYAQGRYRDYPELIYACHGQTISFSSSQELVAVVDGEVLRGRRFTVALSERKVAFFYPAGLSYQPKD